MEKGKEEALKIIVLNMIEMGADINIVVKTTGLDSNFIGQLIADKKK